MKIALNSLLIMVFIIEDIGMYGTKYIKENCLKKVFSE